MLGFCECLFDGFVVDGIVLGRSVALVGLDDIGTVVVLLGVSEFWVLGTNEGY